MDESLRKLLEIPTAQLDAINAVLLDQSAAGINEATPLTEALQTIETVLFGNPSQTLNAV